MLHPNKEKPFTKCCFNRRIPGAKHGVIVFKNGPEISHLFLIVEHMRYFRFLSPRNDECRPCDQIRKYD